MEENIILRDLFKIDDNHSNIRGIVVVKDSDGKIICSRENMIVKTGREAIVKGLDVTGTTSPFNAYFGDNSAMVTANDSILDLGSRGTLNITGYAYSELCVHLKLEKSIAEETDTSFTVNCIGLTVGEGDSEKLFSRVVFPTRYLSPKTSLIFDYYIYF